MADETAADMVVSLVLTILSIIIVSLLVFVILKSLRAYTDVQQSVSVSAECDGLGFEREQPRWRMMFTPSRVPLTCTKTPHVMFNRAYDIFFKWYGKLDKAILLLGLIILVTCVVLLMISSSDFPDAPLYFAYWQEQFCRIWFYKTPEAQSLFQIEGISNLKYGWLPYDFMNRPVRTWKTRQWKVGGMDQGFGIWDNPYTKNPQWIMSIILAALVCIVLNIPWFCLTFSVFLVQLIVQALWLVASFVKGLKILDTHYSHINLFVVVVLLLIYTIFTRMYLRMSEESMDVWRAEYTPSDCGPGPAELVTSMQPILEASTSYQAALWNMGQAWLRFAQPLWNEFKGQTKEAVSVLGFKAYIKDRSLTTPVYNPSAVVLDWLNRVQTNLQLSDQDFGQELYLPLTACLDGLLVGGTDDGNPKFDASGSFVRADNGKCGTNAALMGFMVYDADFMQNVKGANARLYAAMAAVRDSAPEGAFSRFFSRKAMWAAAFVAIIAYLTLLRWNDVAVYYLLLTTLSVAGFAAFMYVCLHLVRTR